MLSPAQKKTLAAALRAETAAAVIAALAIRDDVTLTNWCNANSTTDAWDNAMTSSELFQAADLVKFDSLTAGKRDAFRLMLDFGPHDMARSANRKALVDVWGATESVALLQGCVRKATNGEKYLGGQSATTNSVTALKLNWTGSIAIEEVSNALNTNP